MVLNCRSGFRGKKTAKTAGRMAGKRKVQRGEWYMIVIVCVDDDYGMMFNKRRQSQDKVLRDDMLKFVNGNKLWMNEYSAKQFVDIAMENTEVCEDFLEKAGTGEYCFVENSSVLKYAAKIEKIILYKWNRRYPADFKLDFIPVNQPSGWYKEDTREFAGNSHEKITVEIWGK